MNKKKLLIAILLFSLPGSFILSIIKEGNIDNGSFYSCVFFGIIEIIFCILALNISREVEKIIFETLSFSLFISLVLFCFTIYFIFYSMGGDSSSYHYLYYPENHANLFFWSYVFIGAIASIFIIRHRLNKLDNSL